MRELSARGLARNRAVRDRATKALVNLLSCNLSVAAALLNRFGQVDDPYISERLLAACYGAVMQGIGSYRLHLVASPAYLAERGEPTKLSDLAHHACLHYRYPSTGKLASWPMRQGKIAGGELPLPMTMVVSSLEALVFLAQDGRGIACLPDFSVKTALASGALETVLKKHLTQSTTFWILWPSSKQMTPKVRAFVDFIADRFKHELVA